MPKMRGMTVQKSTNRILDLNILQMKNSLSKLISSASILHVSYMGFCFRQGIEVLFILNYLKFKESFLFIIPINFSRIIFSFFQIFSEFFFISNCSILIFLFDFEKNIYFTDIQKVSLLKSLYCKKTHSLTIPIRTITWHDEWPMCPMPYRFFVIFL